MKQPSQLEFGSIIGERYRIVRTLGSGGMSRVFMAEDLKLPGKQWAVKESVAGPQVMKLVRTEAEMLISLSHPRLPRIVDFLSILHLVRYIWSWITSKELRWKHT